MPCDFVESCGISTRFHVLSLYHRQVAHALLTRPPLTCLAASRRIKQNKFVRLECVRHAASVHPEPGSNSLMFVCQAPWRLPSCIRAIFLLFTCFLSIFYSSKEFRSLYTLDSFHQMLLSLVVQFSMSFASAPLVFRPALADSLHIISHHSSLVNTFFQLFLSFFRVSHFAQLP